MKQYIFEKLLDELDGNSVETLKSKNAKYAKDGDCLHNFREGSDIFGDTMAKTCWGYMTKHLIALRDKVYNNDFSDREDFLEKCQDTINYIRFLWCIGNEENVESKLAEDCEIKDYKTIVVVSKISTTEPDHVFLADWEPMVEDKLNPNWFTVFYRNREGKLVWEEFKFESYLYYFEEEERKDHE
jgi:hypothetical protein